MGRALASPPGLPELHHLEGCVLLLADRCDGRVNLSATVLRKRVGWGAQGGGREGGRGERGGGGEEERGRGGRGRGEM